MAPSCEVSSSSGLAKEEKRGEEVKQVFFPKEKKERGEEFGGREIESSYRAARAETLDY